MSKHIQRYVDFSDSVPFFTILSVLGTSVYVYPRLSEPDISLVGVVFLFTVFAVCFYFTSRDENQITVSDSVRWFCLSLMVLSAFLLRWYLPYDFLSILTIIIVVTLSFLFSQRIVVAQTLILLLAWFAISSYQANQLLWIQSILWGTFHFFAIFMTQIAQKERKATKALQLKNDELKATQTLLSEMSKQNERTRIARELHDLMGHHLTGLAIKLQVAQRLSTGEANEQIQECHQIVKLLLSDVREAVSDLRTDNNIHLTDAIRALTDHISGLKVHLSMSDDLSVSNSEVAETLLRTIQESITNTLKHARAKNCWISLQRDPSSIRLHIKDDGVAPKVLSVGNGLTGMKERAESLGAQLQISTESGAVEISLAYTEV